MALTENPFTDLYQYSGDTGTVIPQTSDVRQMVVSAFNTVFGTSVSTDDETPMGRFVEAITMLIVNVLGVNAQNANMLNPRLATGNGLDAIGAIFGVIRGDGMGDDEYRKIILRGQSNGRGFAESVVRAVSAVSGVKSVLVLNNGLADPSVEPRDEAYSVLVDPHSIMVSVRGGNDADIATAIDGTISLGCGMECSDPNAGEEVQISGGDRTITFYRPDSAISNFKVVASVAPNGYSGDDIEAAVQGLVNDFLEERNVPGSILPSDIVEYINASGSGILCKEVSMFLGGSPILSLVIYPKDYIDFETSEVEVDI